jgi:hypothetical protein
MSERKFEEIIDPDAALRLYLAALVSPGWLAHELEVLELSDDPDDALEDARRLRPVILRPGEEARRGGAR